MKEKQLYITPHIEEVEKEDIKFEKINSIYDVDHNICIHIRKVDTELNVGVVYDFTFENYDDEDTYQYLILKKDNDVYYMTEYYGKFIQIKENYLGDSWEKYTSEEIKNKFGIDMDEWMNEEIQEVSIWKFEKYQGDCAIYAECPICKYEYCAGAVKIETGPEIYKVYNYCPNCGTYLRSKEEDVHVIWNKRDVLDRLGIRKNEVDE